MITSLSELYFRIRRFILLIETKKSDFFGIWQQRKQLKTREMSEACPDISMKNICINSNLNPLTKFTRSSRSTEFKDILPWNISLMITKTLHQHENSHKLCDEKGNTFVNLMESQWKLRQQDDQSFPIVEKPL